MNVNVDFKNWFDTVSRDYINEFAEKYVAVNSRLCFSERTIMQYEDKEPTI